MSRPRPRVRLPEHTAPLLRSALNEAGRDPALFPPGTERWERLARVMSRIAEVEPAGGNLDLRVSPAEWDVVTTCLGRVAKERRVALVALFDRLARQPDTDDRQDADRLLRELDGLDTLLAAFAEPAQTSNLDRARRRWILP